MFYQKVRDQILKKLKAAGIPARKDSAGHKSMEVGLSIRGPYAAVVSVLDSLPFKQLDEDEYRENAHYVVKAPVKPGGRVGYAVIELEGYSESESEITVKLSGTPRWAATSLRVRTLRLASRFPVGSVERRQLLAVIKER